MTNTLPTTDAPAALDPGAPTRLFPSAAGLSLDDHLAHYGPLPRGTATLIDSVEQAGLRGRGGAGFPTAVKLRAVAGRRRRSVVVVNGTEGEPASGKDKALLVYAPHLALDGATVAAEAVGAREIVLCVPVEIADGRCRRGEREAWQVTPDLGSGKRVRRPR